MQARPASRARYVGRDNRDGLGQASHFPGGGRGRVVHHAGETSGLSQSAVSRQVGALDKDLGAPLFHRHARGLILTEQGETLLKAVHDVSIELEAVRSRLIDSRDKPHGDLRVTTTLALGANWLSSRLGEFVELFPEVKKPPAAVDDDLDIGMREADVALRLREPLQPDLIRRRLFTVHFHAYASADYLKRHGQPRSIERSRSAIACSPSAP